jgi:hypothetical protein
VNKTTIDVVVGHIHNNLDKERKQFNLSRKSRDQLNYVYEMLQRTNPTSHSAIVEHALDAYFKIFQVAEKLKK